MAKQSSLDGLCMPIVLSVLLAGSKKNQRMILCMRDHRWNKRRDSSIQSKVIIWAFIHNEMEIESKLEIWSMFSPTGASPFIQRAAITAVMVDLLQCNWFHRPSTYDRTISNHQTLFTNAWEANPIERTKLDQIIDRPIIVSVDLNDPSTRDRHRANWRRSSIYCFIALPEPGNITRRMNVSISLFLCLSSYFYERIEWPSMNEVNYRDIRAVCWATYEKYDIQPPSLTMRNVHMSCDVCEMHRCEEQKERRKPNRK